MHIIQKNSPRRKRRGLYHMSRSVSRVLSSTTIYLGLPLPTGSSHLLRAAGPAYMLSHGVAPDRVYSTDMSPCGGWALTPPFHLFPAKSRKVVYFCCTCPRVTPGGRYPLSLPYGARTFLMYSLSTCTRGRSVCSRGLFYPNAGVKSIIILYLQRKSLIIFLL